MGDLSPTTRQEVEEKAFGVPKGSSHDRYPIYGYLTSKGPNIDDPDAAAMYGDAKLVLKDHCRDRATFTVGDSLGNLETGHVLPAPVVRPDSLAGDELVSRIVGGSIDGDSPDKIRDAEYGYWETQIHGGVSTDDIDHIVLDTDPSETLGEAGGQRITRALQASGIPWRSRRQPSNAPWARADEWR